MLRCQAFYQNSYLSNTLAFIIRRIQVYFGIIFSFLYVNNINKYILDFTSYG